MAIAQVLEVLDEADSAPSPVIELPLAGPAPDRTPCGWRSRCVATLAYLLTLAGLIAVATLGANDGTVPASGSTPGRVVVSGDPISGTP